MARRARPLLLVFGLVDTPEALGHLAVVDEELAAVDELVDGGTASVMDLGDTVGQCVAVGVVLVDHLCDSQHEVGLKAIRRGSDRKEKRQL